MRDRTRIERCVLAKPVCFGVLVLGTSTACPFEDVPPCPGQCFDYTLERASPIWCSNEEGASYPIAFTGNDPPGYRGRTCFNSTFVPLVVAAIEHRQVGGELSDLSAAIVGAYVTTVSSVRADLEAECILAAPGQCINAAEVCSVVGADAYERLVVEQSCTLSLDGTEPVVLASGQTCEPIAADQTTDADGSGDHCLEPTTTTTTAVDDTADPGDTDDTAGMLLPTNLRPR